MSFGVGFIDVYDDDDYDNDNEDDNDDDVEAR